MFETEQRLLADITIKVGTRNSKLARIQTQLAIDYIQSFYPNTNFRVVPIITQGDKILDRPLYDIGGKALFTKEIENSLVLREIDLAIHSAKDIESDYPKESLCFPCVLPMEDNRDVFIEKNYEHQKSNIYNLKNGSIIGSSSVRRQAQIKKLLPNTSILCESIRGNVNTRLEKLKLENIDGVILAAAGLKRLNALTDGMQILTQKEMLPAVGQGIIAIQSRIDNVLLNTVLSSISDKETNIKFRVSRAFVETVNGSCITPLAMNISVDLDTIDAEFLIISNTTDFSHAVRICDSVENAEIIGIKAGKEIFKYLKYI